MALTVGTRLGPYEILALIGVGGMGEVYRARDSKLNREVAIKVLPAAFASDPDRMARFQREAHVLASLNHPHIAAIYGFEESGSMRALVMELAEGPTLAERIRSGPIPPDEAFRLAQQIAEALEYAHDRGVIHRDLKPANIKITPDGSVKLLDFGLAKALEGDAASVPPQDSPTFTLEATRAGVILGTAAYMSPEQAKGKPVDRRADIWAFGVVLYEMLTGKQLYTGETGAEILASVMKDQLSLDHLPAGTPAAVRNLIARCLERDVRRRLSHIGEARIILEDPLSTSQATAISPPPSRPVKWMALSGFLLVAFAVLAFVHFRQAPEETRVLKFTLGLPENALLDGISPPAVSPDGRRVAFVATASGRQALWVRDLDSLVPRQLPGTDGAFEPFWSPDSRYIAFFSSGKLKKVDVGTTIPGPVLSLCDSPGGFAGGTWSKSNVILFAANTGLSRCPAGGGNASPVIELDRSSGEDVLRFPWFLPDGRHFLYSARNTHPEKNEIYAGALDSKTRRPVVAASSSAAFSPPGYLLFLREGTLMAQPFDAAGLETSGDPIPIAEQVAYHRGEVDALFSSSQNGVLVYASGRPGGLQLGFFDRSGKLVSTVGAPGVIQWPTVSADGNSVAIDRLDPQTGFFDIWLHDLKRGTERRFTFNSKNNDSPIWSPDSSHIGFRSSRDGGHSLYQKATSGAAQDEPLHKSASLDVTPDDWSRDGRYIFETILDPKTKGDVWVLPLFGDRKPFPYLQGEYDEDFPRLSPNGRWLAYHSDETNRYEIYVQGFPNHTGKWQISSNGGSTPAWSRDGKELFYVAADQKLMAVEVKGGAEFETGVPKPLFQPRIGLDPTGSPWFDVSKDGLFLIPSPVEQASRLMTVVVNWTAGLKK
jgi:serine/threonine protein kinase/Tol biopolymer transport system component